MKRYILFSGIEYHPFGGWNDFSSTGDDPEELKLRLRDDEDWAHIFCTHTMKVVSRFSRCLIDPGWVDE